MRRLFSFLVLFFSYRFFKKPISNSSTIYFKDVKIGQVFEAADGLFYKKISDDAAIIIDLAEPDKIYLNGNTTKH
jgi:hypothetical protein